MADGKSLGIALSGGGAKGICHLGVLQALEEHDIYVDGLSGTSAGAMVAALYSYGYSPREIMKIIARTRFFNVLGFTATFNGLLTLEKMGKILEKHMPENDFSALKKPVYIAATELIAGKTQFFSEGELIAPILASCCVPVVFNPLEYKDGIYVDGGILKNLPAEILRDKGYETVIGSDCNPIDNNFTLTGVKKLVERSLLLAINGNNSYSKKFCDFVVEPPGMKQFSAFDLAKAQDIFDTGYKYTVENIDKIKKEISIND